MLNDEPHDLGTFNGRKVLNLLNDFLRAHGDNNPQTPDLGKCAKQGQRFVQCCEGGLMLEMVAALKKETDIAKAGGSVAFVCFC